MSQKAGITGSASRVDKHHSYDILRFITHIYIHPTYRFDLFGEWGESGVRVAFCFFF